MGCLLTGCSESAAPQNTDASSAAAVTALPTEIPTETEHSHTFGDWALKEAASCSKNGVEERICTGCQESETRPTDTIPHDLNTYNICKKCQYVSFDPDAQVVELGVFSNYYYTNSAIANYVWDVKIWGDLVYRGAGDYNKNAGTAPILAFNKETQHWVRMGITDDQALQRYVEIGGTLYAPGIDPNGSWSWGNFYMLDGEKWKKVRNLPGGIHNFDMIEFDGKIFAGLGTEVVDETIAVSEDGGKTFQFVPLYQDGMLFNLDSYKSSRTYEFVEYNGKLYAMVSFLVGIGYQHVIFCYDNGKMVYQGIASGMSGGITSNRNYWSGKFEKDGICYITAGNLFAITDFANIAAREKIDMPNDEKVADALLHNNTIYTLCYSQKKNNSGYTIVVYQSATGKNGSFTEVVRCDYPAMPCSFDFDGEHFYIGTGYRPTDAAKSGMLLRVKPGT